MGLSRLLTDEQAVRIRTDFARGYRSANQLAAELNVSQATIFSVVQGSTYKSAGGPITWPDGCITGKNRRPIPKGAVRGRCRDVACKNPIAASGWAKRMHMCESCFRLNGGRKCGRTPAGRMKRFKCRRCGIKKEYYVRPNGYCPRFCSRACQTLDSAEQRTKRPATLTKEALYELYWGRDKTAVEIAQLLGGAVTPSCVVWWLRADGTPRRAKNWRIYPTCAVDGCDEPKHKLFNGIRWYGRLCNTHLNERSRNRARFYKERIAEQRGGELERIIDGLTTGLPDAVRLDAKSEIMIACLSGDIPLPPTKDSVKPLISKVFRDNADAWKFVSLAAPTRDGEDAQTWGERLGIA